MNVKKQNNCLNFFKGLACILVVSLHLRFPYEPVDNIVQCMARFAVPIFFMISGYFTFRTDSGKMIKSMPRKIRHIGVLCAGSFVYWFVITFAGYIVGDSGNNPLEWVVEVFGFKRMMDFVLFNADPVINILWFFFALLYCYVIVYGFLYFNKINQLKAISAILLITHFVMGNWSGFFGFSMRAEYYRNAWFMGIPLFMIGYCISEYREQILAKISESMALAGIILGGAFSYAEWLVVGGRQQMYIGSIMTASCMIIYSLYNPEKCVIKPIAIVGEKYSMLVYVLHLSVGIVLDKLVSFVGADRMMVYAYLKPSLAILFTVIISMLVTVLFETLKRSFIILRERG